MVQSGLVDKWKEEEIAKLGGRDSGGRGKRRGQISAITITHLQGAFFLYVMGVALALTALLLEKTGWRWLSWLKVYGKEAGEGKERGWWKGCS